MAPDITLPSGWWPPFAAAVLAWNVMALLGALASYGDAAHGAAGPAFGLLLLRFVLQYLPLSALSLVLARAMHGAGMQRLPGARPLVFLVFVPLLVIWQSALDGAFHGRPMGTPLALLAQQSVLTWWFDFLLLTITAGAHFAYSAWRHAHLQALAAQRAQQDNLALRLRLLQGQLQPYFLSGSLAGIDTLIRSGRRDDATHALVRLSDLLRYALRASQAHWQSMADEIQFLRDYIDLQSLCHGTNYAVQWQIEQGDWADYRCPPLLLFPMVEQALCAAPGALGIRIARDGQQVHIEVQDGGKGEALAGLRARLAMLYGEAATLNIGHQIVRLSYPVSHAD